VDIPASDKDGKTYAPLVTYTINVTTGTCRGAGTDANMFVILYGESGDSGKQILEGPGNLFERGKTDVFSVKCVDLGKLKRIRIGHDGAGLGAGWFCQEVNVESSAGKTWKFPCSKWFDSHEGDKLIERDLQVDGEPGPAVANYLVTVVTGRKKGGGTDANVFISIVGASGRVDDISLDNNKNNFETGQVDKFKVQTLDLGELKDVTIRHDNTGIGPGWYLDRVNVEIEGTTRKWMFPCAQWLDKSEGDGKISRKLTPGTVYVVKIVTGKEKGAGTDSNIFCKLHGKGNSDEIHLAHSDNVNKFEQGKTDTFSIGHSGLGTLTGITIRSDNAGAGSDWLLERIEIVDEGTGTAYKAACNTWFNKKLLEQKYNL